MGRTSGNSGTLRTTGRMPGRSLELVEASDIQRHLSQNRVTTMNLYPIGFIDSSQRQVHMRALIGFLLLSVALSLLSSVSRAQTLGRCEPAQAVKIIDSALNQNKTLNDAMQLMIKAKVFDGSKACISFIRETSMSMREQHPKAFRALWMN